MSNPSTINFIKKHREEDVHSLALKAHCPAEVDLPWALEQIQGWQTARGKLPSWSLIDGLVYPPRLSMEQCSSEKTAFYKCGIIDRLPQGSHDVLIDLTGGFGVDFAFLATKAHRAVYVERQDNLCEIAKHNFDHLGLNHATVICDETERVLNDMATRVPDASPHSTLIYIDPARRDMSNKSRTYAIADCTPNVLEIKDKIMSVAHHALIKLSPMLDWHKAVRDLGPQVKEVHIVSVGNECKELLILLAANHHEEPTVYCANDDQTLMFRPSEVAIPIIAPTTARGTYLYEPNASIMAAGCFGIVCQRYSVKALSSDSHLFLSDEFIANFPGRGFKIEAVATLNKKELKNALAGISRANITTRNFPMTVRQLRDRLRLADGGDSYIFGTTTADGQHIIYLCNKL